MLHSQFNKIIFFFLILVVIFVGLSLYYYFRITANDNFILQKRFFDNLPSQDIKAVFLGDSRTGIDVKNEYLSPGYFNFSYPGENWEKLLIREKYILKNKQDVQYFIVACDEHVFSGYRASDEDYFDYFYMFSPKELIDFKLLSRSSLYKNWLTHYVPLLKNGNRAVFGELIIKDTINIFKPGYNKKITYFNSHGDFLNSTERMWPIVNETERQSATQGELNAKLKVMISPQLVAAFTEFMRLARAAEIPVIGIRYPTSLEHQAYLKTFNLSAVNKLFAQEQIKIYNYTDTLNNHQDFFTDHEHLNSKGGEYFTKILMQDLPKAINL